MQFSLNWPPRCNVAPTPYSALLRNEALRRGLNSEVTLNQIQDQLKQQVRSAALELFGIELDELSSATPPRPELGDLAFPVSFELAKLIKQGTGTKVAPRTIAEQLKGRLESTPEVARVEVAGNVGTPDSADTPAPV